MRPCSRVLLDCIGATTVKPKTLIAVACFCLIGACDNKSEDSEMPYGVWRATFYEIEGVQHKQDGLIIITPDFLMSNTIFDADGDIYPDANANSGPIKIEDDVIVMEQWMQLHWRTADDEGNFLTQGVVERIPYKVEGDLLIFEFPSGNRYTSTREAYLQSSD